MDGRASSIAPSIRLAETSGRGDAIVTAITFNLADGVAWPEPVVCAYGPGTRVGAGSEATILPTTDRYGDYEWSFSVPDDYAGRLAVTVAYEDAEGRRGTAGALVELPWLK